MTLVLFLPRLVLIAGALAAHVTARTEDLLSIWGLFFRAALELNGKRPQTEASRT